MIPATRSTICIGSAYWPVNCWTFETFFASANVFLPYVSRRESASAVVSPAAGSTPSRLAASAGESAYQLASGVVPPFGAAPSG